MIFEAAIGLTGGMALAVALAGLRGVRNWLQAARWIAYLSIALMFLVTIGLMAGGLPRLAAIVTLVATGGAQTAAPMTKSRPPAEVSPKLLLISSLLFGLAALTTRAGEVLPFYSGFGVPGFGVPVFYVGILTLPGIRAAIGEWRKPAQVSSAVPDLAGVAVMVSAVVVFFNLLARGAWLDSSPGSAWLAIAWITSSGSLLMKPGRPRAALTLVAAVTILAALSLLSL